MGRNSLGYSSAMVENPICRFYLYQRRDRRGWKTVFEGSWIGLLLAQQPLCDDIQCILRNQWDEIETMRRKDFVEYPYI